MTAVPTSVLALLFAVACGSPRDLGAPSATASGSAAPESSSVVPSASASATKPADKSALLRSGRKLSQAGQWKEAAQALDRARALDPDDVIVLSELGWAELNAADLTASQATSEHALSVAKEPRLRAQVLYNLGRVAEANGDRDTAKKRYEESLALRASRAVQSRLESLGGKAPPAARAPASQALPCDRAFPNTQALCDCLMGQKAMLALESDAKLSCGADRSAPKLESGELTVLRWGAEEGANGEALHLLAANVKGGLRPVAQLGRDYESVAMGISNHAHVTGFEERGSGGRRLVLVRTEQSDSDANDGGHELFTTRALRVTACVLRDEHHDTTCPFFGPLEIDDSLTYPGDSEHKGGYHRAARFDLVLANEKATLTLVSGKASLASPAALGPHVLW